MHVWKVSKSLLTLNLQHIFSNVTSHILQNYWSWLKVKNVWFFRYVYGDLYAGAIWAGSENPENSGNFSTSKIPFSCGRDSPIACTSVPGSSLPALGYVFSFGEDNRKDIFVLSSSGVYRIVRPSRCNYTCSKENVTSVATPGPSASPNDACWISNPPKTAVFLVSSLVLLLLLSFV